MKTRIIAAAVILPVALAILLIFPPYVLTITMSVISAIAAYELIGAVNKTCKNPPSPRVAVYAGIGAVMVPFMVYFNTWLLPFVNIFTGIDESNVTMFDLYVIGMLTIFLVLMCLMLIDFFLTLKSEKRIRWQQLLATPFAAIIIPLMLSSLIALRLQEAAEGSNLGRWLVMLPVIVTVLTDSGAYFTGVAIGKHKPFPKISPNKTVEGFVGGIALGIAGLLIYGLIINGTTGLTANIPLLLVYGLTGAVITEIGDLAFSLLKRKCGIKDYGKLIPGHGGILDRFDSLSFTAPAMLALVALIPAIR